MLCTLEGHTSSVRSVAFSHDGRRIVSGSDDNTVRVWSSDTGVLEQTLEGHTDWVHSVAFSHDGWRIVSGSNDNTVRAWSSDTGVLEHTLEGHMGSVYSVAFSHDGRHLISYSEFGKVKVWSLDTGKLERAPKDSPVLHSALSLDSSNVLEYENQLSLEDGWVIRHGRFLCCIPHDSRIYGSSSMDEFPSRNLLCLGSNSGLITILDFSGVV